MTPRTSIHIQGSSRQLVHPRGAAELIHLALGRLTPRDWQLIRLLHEHRVLTTQHVCDALFPSKRRAEMRLLDLYRLRVLDRFRPFSRTGSEPYHWVLDEVGAQLIAWVRRMDAAAARTATGRRRKRRARGRPSRPRQPAGPSGAWAGARAPCIEVSVWRSAALRRILVRTARISAAACPEAKEASS